ncbi:MAG: toll/interleukin-1 receptor domain-containing protein [Acidiferrobacterales bacterium]|nr:toll/interleukin-1 receptor domain-containing protein [Acidiferrobacterales bacterium]
MLYDVFICHASEDKEEFVRPLAESLKDLNIEVWYDEFSLVLGDSLRRSIDLGLRQSRFGVVVLSPSFFSKNWTQYELDGLLDRELAGNDKVLLPVWFNLSADEVRSYSPSLAGRKAAVASNGLDSVLDQIVSVVNPQGSPLINARDLLLEHGVKPPVITDSYWLDVVEASNRLSASGAFIPDEQVWGRWSFPLPWKEGSAKNWGERLAWTAMQMDWTSDAERRFISPLTRPEKVIDFISCNAGLDMACQFYPALFAEYAPQLTIEGFGGHFEEVFEKAYLENCDKRMALAAKSPQFGSGLTTNQQPPLCDEEWIFRCPTFGNYEASSVACEYFTGGMHGPTVSPYEHADHLFWLLSHDSTWLPEKLHSKLLEGMLDWAVWHWSEIPTMEDRAIRSMALFRAMMECSKSGGEFVWSDTIEEDVRSRISSTIDRLGLEDSTGSILARFIENDCPIRHIASNDRRLNRE